MALFTICSSHVLFGLPWDRYWFQSISFLWWNGRSFKTSRIGSKPRGPEHVCCLRLQQNSTHSTVSQSTSHTCLDCSVWGMSLHQQSLPICKHLISEYYIFYFLSSLSAWSLAFSDTDLYVQKKFQPKQTINRSASYFPGLSFQSTLVNSKTSLLAAKL